MLKQIDGPLLAYSANDRHHEEPSTAFRMLQTCAQADTVAVRTDHSAPKCLLHLARDQSGHDRPHRIPSHQQ